MEIAKVKSNFQIDFSTNVKNWLSTETELAILIEGDTLVLKKIQIPKLTTLADRKDEVEMPLEEIVEEVHNYRIEKKEK